MGVGLLQECVLSPLLFIVYINWIDKCSQADECAKIGNCKISRLLFADDLVLLFFTKSGLQRAFNSFADICDTTGMKISSVKSEVLHLSRFKLVEEFKYFGLHSRVMEDEELNTQIGKASELMRALHYLVVMKRELSKKAKLSISKQIFAHSHIWS